MAYPDESSRIASLSLSDAKRIWVRVWVRHEKKADHDVRAKRQSGFLGGLTVCNNPSRKKTGGAMKSENTVQSPLNP